MSKIPKGSRVIVSKTVKTWDDLDLNGLHGTVKDVEYVKIMTFYFVELDNGKGMTFADEDLRLEPSKLSKVLA